MKKENKGEGKMKKAKINMVIGLEIGFLIATLVFNGQMHQKAVSDGPRAIRALGLAQDAWGVETPDKQQRAQAELAIVGSIVDAARNFQASVKDDKVHKRTVKATLEKASRSIQVAMSLNPAAEPPAGFAPDLAISEALAERGIDMMVAVEKAAKSSSAGELVPEEPLEQMPIYTGAVKAWAQILSQIKTKEAVVIAPPTPQMLNQMAAMLVKNLPEELGRSLILPADAESWREVFGTLHFKTAVTYGTAPGAEVPVITPFATRLGLYAAEFAESTLVETKSAQGFIPTYTYPHLYASRQDMESARRKGIEYGLMAIAPAIVGGEYIKTEGTYVTNPLVVRPINIPVIVSLQRHMTAEGKPYQIPEAKKIHPAEKEKVIEQLFENPVSESASIFVEPGQPALIPAGLGYTITNPTVQPAVLEYLTSSEQMWISGLYQKLGGGAHRIITATGEEALIQANTDYFLHYKQLAEDTLATPINLSVLGMESGQSLYNMLGNERAAAFLNAGELEPEVAIGANAPLVEFNIVTERGIPAVERIEQPALEKVLGIPVSVKAASAGVVPAAMYQFRIEPTQIKRLGAKEEVLGTLDWNLDQLKQAEGIAGVTLAEAPKTMETAKKQIEKLLAEIKLPTVELGKITTEEEGEFVQPAAKGLERVIVPISTKESIVMEEAAGTYQPVLTRREVATIMKQARVERGAILIDFNALGIKGQRKDGSDVFVPSDYVMRAIAILNNIKDQKMADGTTPRYHAAVYSDNISTRDMQNLLGALAVPFDGFIQSPTVRGAIDQIAQEQKIEKERFVVTIANSTINRNPKVLDGFAKLAEAVNLVMVKTPKPGEYASYKSILLNSLRLLEGILTPQQITDLGVEIENAPAIRGLTIEPEEDKDKAVSRMQAAVSV